MTAQVMHTTGRTTEYAVERDTHGAPVRITFPRPSNFHAHLRSGLLMHAIAPHIMRHVEYLLVMPNTGPIRTIPQALEYYGSLIKTALRQKIRRPHLIMTLYHTADITPAVVEAIAGLEIVRAIKHYPPEPGVTTGSGHGIPLEESDEMLRAMIDRGVPLLGHFEAVRDKHNRLLDPLDGEAYYVKEHLWRLRDKYRGRLRICFEHVSTKEGIEFVQADISGNTVCTITPQHGLCNHDDLTRRSWGNHLKCKPIAQTPENQAVVTKFMTSGDVRAIAGDDTAAHLASTKNVDFARAANGCFWTSHSIAAYARIFVNADALDDRFIKFMSFNGPLWWGLPLPTGTITLRREIVNDIPGPVPVPEENDEVIPLGWTLDADRLQLGFAVES